MSNRRVDKPKRVTGKAILTGAPNYTHASVATPPELRDGQRRCPVCRNGAGLTPNGFLRQHRDLFDNPCTNRATGDPVAVPALPPPVPMSLVPESDANRVPPNGHCQECSKPIPPMRRLCGRCMAHRGRP